MFSLAHRKRKITRETPLTVFEKVRGEYSALLLSGAGVAGGVAGKVDNKSKTGGGRYSYIGYEPFLLFEARDGVQEVSTISYSEDGSERDVHLCQGDDLEVFQSIFEQINVKRIESDFPPFVGGAMGFMSYDFGVKMLGVKADLIDDTEVPDMYFAFYDKVIVFDHEMGDVYFFGLGENPEQAQKIVLEVEHDALYGLVTEEKPISRKSPKRGKNLQMFLSKEDFFRKVSEIKTYLHDGETYQVNFSHRFAYETSEEAFEIFRRLTKINPSPFMGYFEHPEMCVMSCSPEKLVSVEKGLVETRPIKGTRPRGKTAKEDAVMEKELLDSKKEAAELTMIVDLMRNDLGQVCEARSVKVMDHRAIEKYSHVMHTVTTVQGKLKKGKSVFDLVRAVFPGGSVTGCPKKRTVEIIARLEDYARDVYCGSAGYFSVSGDMALNILIRTLLYKQGEVVFHSGGGIVIDSDPEAELNETLDKAQALVEGLIGSSED